MTDPNTTAAINRILLRTAINADPIIGRSKEQILERVSKLRGELHDMGYSVVRTKLLDAIYDHIPAEEMDRLTLEASK